MPNKKTVALTKEQYYEILKAMDEGGTWFRPNEQIKTVLICEANLGPRIQDILNLTLNNFVKDGESIKLSITEQKTSKVRYLTINRQIYEFLCDYCKRNNIAPNEQMFNVGERTVQLYLQKVAMYLDYENIGTHSFRKFYAMNLYKATGYDIVAVQHALNHSSPAITQRYLGITTPALESALNKCVML